MRRPLILNSKLLDMYSIAKWKTKAFSLSPRTLFPEHPLRL